MLWRLRVLFFYTTIAILSIVLFSPSALAAKLININYGIRYKVAIIFSYAFIWLARFICGLKYQVSGLEKLPKVPCIVLSNHQSFWENIFMQLIIPCHSWVIKHELFNIPFFGWGLKMLQPIAVNRQNHRSVNQIFLEGQEKLKKGLWLIIFPEATRLKPDQTKKFKPSAIKLALIAKVPLVLITHNAGVYWPKGFWIKSPGTIQIKVVDVIYYEQAQHFDVRSLTDKVEQIINSQKQMLFEQTLVN